MSDLLETIDELRFAWSAATSELPARWSPERPSTGQCCVTAMILRAIYGGELVRATASTGDVHYWNLIDGVTVDATRDQFPEDTTFQDVVVHPDPALYLNDDLVTKVVMLMARAAL